MARAPAYSGFRHFSQIINLERMAVETALDWFRRTNGNGNNDDESTNDHSCSDPSTAAWRFLRHGKSGIAPIDAAWKHCRNKERQQHQRLEYRQSPPPVVVLEGPKDVGKTWML